MKEFDLHYQAEKEPEKKERYGNWATAKGLQQVDGLETSAYLDKVATDSIEGRISAYEAIKLVDSYYEVKGDREAERQYEEADKVAARINAIISETGFTLCPEELQQIHQRLFGGVFSHAGQFRTLNFIKREWVLDGGTVTYGDFHYIRESLERYVKREKSLRYASMDEEEAVYHLARFVSDIWQIHPFNEGNTRSVAVFAIKYFRSLGYEVDNTAFHEHSWYFRNALVRANYTSVSKKVDADLSYLEGFLSSVLLGKAGEFHNRDLHIYAIPHAQTKTGVELDKAIVKEIKADATITRDELAQKFNTSRKTIERHLKEMGVYFEGPAKAGHWVLGKSEEIM